MGEGPPTSSCGFRDRNSALSELSPTERTQEMNTLTSVPLPLCPSGLTQLESEGDGDVVHGHSLPRVPRRQRVKNRPGSDQRRFSAATTIPILQVRAPR